MKYTRHSADVARILLAAGDGTFNLNGDRVIEIDGYEVGGLDPDMPKDIRPEDLPGGQVEARLAERIFHLRQEEAVELRLGRWYDEETGLLHFDATVHVTESLEVALQVGRFFNQICVWDWANQTTIDCNEEEA